MVLLNLIQRDDCELLKTGLFRHSDGLEQLLVDIRTVISELRNNRHKKRLKLSGTTAVDLVTLGWARHINSLSRLFFYNLPLFMRCFSGRCIHGYIHSVCARLTNCCSCLIKFGPRPLSYHTNQDACSSISYNLMFWSETKNNESFALRIIPNWSWPNGQRCS